MRISRIFKTTWLGAALSCAGLMTASAQLTANWIGASGGEWNTLANWDIGIPDAGTNAVIGSTFTVNYNLPMVSAGFAVLTNNGVLNINTNGFNDAGIYMLNPGGTGKLFINSGGAVNVAGDLAYCSNSAVALAAGGSLTIDGSLLIGCGTTGGSSGSSTGNYGVFTNSGGNLSALVTGLNLPNGSVSASALLAIYGGTNNLGTVTIKRSNAGSGGYSALGTEGLMIYGGLVTMTNLNVGGGNGNSFLSARISGGVVTNFGNVSINQSTGGSSPRGSRLLQTGGLFVVPDPNLVEPNPTVSGSLNVYSVTGGTNIVGGFYFGNTSAGAGTVNFTNAATIYVGSQGIGSNGVVVLNAALNNGGLFGATVPWSGSANMKLTSGTFTFQTADMDGNPNGITLTGALGGVGNLNVTGGGILTLDGANTYSGNTLISGGTLTVGADGSITSPGIMVGSGTTFDVSQVSGFTLSGSQALSGFGTVTGAVTAAASSTIYPGSNTLTGTLTFTSGLIENGNANNEFYLSGNPSGLDNDFINVSPGSLAVSGTNGIIINGTLTSGEVYPLFSYGSLSGDVTNFIVSGADGVLSNNPTTQTIYFIVQSSVRGPTNITWIGNAAANNWDTEITTNWLNNGTGLPDFFVPGDLALFSNLGATNPLVNINGSVNPGSITVNTTSNYTFNGSGVIGGLGSLTVSNGTLNILTTNMYTGQTILAGGVLATPVLANSLSPSGIGAASSDPGNLIFNGGTFSYFGASTGTDHGLTLTNNGGTIDVTNGTALTLNGAIVGNGTLSVVDSGTLILANANSYTNNTIIAGGNLQLNNANGAGTGSIISSNGTLIFYPSGGLMLANPFSFVAGTTNTIVVTSGGGSVNPTSTGNWSGSGTVMVNNTFSPFTVSGNMDAFTGTVLMTTPNGSQFRFYGNTGSTNATFDLGTNNAVLISRNAGTINLGALRGGVGTSVIGQGADSGTLVWAIGYNNLSTTFYGAIANNAANEISALTKVGTGTLTLSSGGITTNISQSGIFITTNIAYLSKLTYTGNTTISNGVLALVVPTVLTNTPLVTMASSAAILDASAMGIVSNQYDSDGVTVTNQVLVTNGVFEVVSGQTLTGLGTIRGSLLADSGSTLNVGLAGSTGTLIVTNSISLNGATTMKISRVGSPASDELVAQQSAISFGGTLTVTNIGGQLQTGDTFTLFSAAGSAYNNSFSSIVLPTGVTWDTTQLAVNGTIRVSVGSGPPVIGSVNFSQLSSGSITLNAANGTPGAAVSVLSSTNVALPLVQWTTVTSGNFDGNGNYTPTISVNPAAPQQYFILQTQ